MRSLWLGSLLTLVILSAAGLLPAQEKITLAPQAGASLQAYDINREVTLVGTVVAFSSSSKTPPAGPRTSVQTPAGLVDVHLGNARLLAANHFTIQPGDTLRIVGENVSFSGGSQFVARIVQKGTQVLLLRSTRGFPIVSAAPRGASESTKQGSAL
jgi:hypothetical protein